MRQACRSNLFQGYLVGKEEVGVSLLQFVDDTLFFARDSIHNVMCLKSILRCFELTFSSRQIFSKVA